MTPVVEATPVLVGIICFVILAILIVLRMSIAFSMAFVGFAGVAYFVSFDAALTKLGVVAFDTVSSYDLATLPLFLLMANTLFAAGMGKDLYTLAARWIGHLRGGLAMATIGGCAIFAAVSASSMATAATLGLVSLPEMKKREYDPGLATGTVIAGGTLGATIPPSGVLIIYGIFTQNSISQLFMAGIIPGIVQAAMYCAAIYLIARRNPRIAPGGPRYSYRERVAAFKDVWDTVFLIVLVIGGMLIGLFTATEAAAVGAAGAIAISTVRRRLTIQSFQKALLDTLKTTGMIYAILIGAMMFNALCALTTIPNWLANSVAGLAVPPVVTMLLIIIAYLIIGGPMDGQAMMLLTLPIFLPIVTALGYDQIWFGVMIARMVEIAMISPPLGMNIFVIQGVAQDVPMRTIFKGLVPFLAADTVQVLTLLLVPGIVLLLPSFMR